MNYIIVNANKIEKRIKDLQFPIAHYDGVYISDIQETESNVLQDLLSNSIPLIPEIEKAFNAGEDSKFYEESKEDYISELKLEI